MATSSHDEEHYAGRFDVNRHVLLTGVSRYDYPHIVVTKEGRMRNELKLNLTEDAPESVLNCVEAAGIAGEKLVSSSNCSYVESSWLPCCPSDIGLEKRSEIDSLDPSVVIYTITLKNSGNSSMEPIYM